jgi:hypothetical protein
VGAEGACNIIKGETEERRKKKERKKENELLLNYIFFKNKIV